MAEPQPDSNPPLPSLSLSFSSLVSSHFIYSGPAGLPACPPAPVLSTRTRHPSPSFCPLPTPSVPFACFA